MKILHIVPSYIPAFRYGGPIESTHNVNAALVRAGHEVTVFTTDIDGAGRLDVPTNAPVIKDGVRVFYFRGSFPASWFYSKELHKALKTKLDEFDIIHISSVFLAASTLGAYYAKKFKKPYILSAHGSLMKEPLRMGSFKKKLYITFLEKKNLENAAAIRFTVPREEEEYRAAGFPLKCALLVPNSVRSITCVDEEHIGAFRRDLGITQEKKIILFLGRISPIKGLDTLLGAFKKVLEMVYNSTLLIVGGDDEGYKATIERYIKECGLSNDVIFAGMLTGERKSSALCSADVFVVPSISESFGMSAAEAMGAGVPTIMTEGVGIAMAAATAGAGIVTKKDEESISAEIVSILTNEEKQLVLRHRGIEFIKNEFSDVAVAKKFIEGCQRVLFGK